MGTTVTTNALLDARATARCWSSRGFADAALRIAYQARPFFDHTSLL